jgi:hypothetical protein
MTSPRSSGGMASTKCRQAVGKIVIGPRHRHDERVCRELSGIALEEIIDIRSAAQKDAAQDQRLHRCGMRNRVSQGEGAAPAAAENMHPAVDAQLVAQRQHVVDQVLGRIVCQRRGCVIIARTGRTLAAAALVEKDDTVPLRVEKPGERAVAARTWPTMHDDDRLAGERAVFLPVDPMLRKSRRDQMAGPDEGRVRRLGVPALFCTTVWVFASTEMISAIEGAGCECEQAPASPAAYAKIAGAVFELDVVAVFLAWGSFRS